MVRELTQADLVLLETMDRGVKAPTVKKLRDSHHMLARLLATGKRPAEVSALTGYSPSRISILQNDPAFKELLAHYSGLVEEIDGGMLERLKMFNLEVLEEMRGRLEERPEAVADDTLTDWAKLGLDRTGHGPQSRSTNIQVNLDLSERVRLGRERAARLTSSEGNGLLTPPMIEGSVVPTDATSVPSAAGTPAAEPSPTPTKENE